MSSGISAIGRLAALVLLVAAFFFGMAGVVYMSLQGTEIKVPEITGKGFSDSEKELASLGLKIKKRADRFSSEDPNTVIEQLPKPGETVKTGQLILVVTSKGPGEGDQPPTLKNEDEDDSEKIEEMISDKPKKKAGSNSNRKKADTARDVAGNTADNRSVSGTEADPGTVKKDGGTSNTSTDRPGRVTPNPSANRAPAAQPGRPGETKPRTQRP